MDGRTKHIRALNEERVRSHERLNKLYDTAVAERGLTSEARAEEASILADITRLEGEIRRFVDQHEREEQSAAIRNAFAPVFQPMGTFEREDREDALVRGFFDGSGPSQLRVPMASVMREREAIRNGADPARIRNNLTGDSGTGTLLVPTLLANQIYEVMEAEVAAFRLPTTKINTPTGAPMNWPKVATHGIGTQVIAQGTTIGGTDAVFEQKALNVYKYGQLVNLASEIITDSSIDIVGLVARDAARAVGRVIDADLVNGTGSGEPQGIMPAITGAGTIHGSVSGITYENLVDLQFSVNSGYRSSGKTAWLLRDETAGAVRKLRDGAGGTVGAPLWKSNESTGGMANYAPPTLLGDPVWTDANMASIASTNKVAVFGDWSSYYVRTVGDLMFERDDSLGFDKDTVYFRCKWRVGGQVMETDAFNVLRVV